MSFSVLISVYEKENPRYLDEALCSIWDQQTMKPGQIVLVKDGPLTEELDACINIWNQKLGDTLTIVGLPENVGLGAALNSGLQYCRYELVARMDSDDISLPDRFEKQTNILKDNPELVLLSGYINEFKNEPGDIRSIRKVPISNYEIIKHLKWRNAFNHVTVIFKKSAVLSVGSYNTEMVSFEDYDLWIKLIQAEYKVSNIPEILVNVRIGNNMINRRYGLSYAKKELSFLKLQKSRGFISANEYFLLIIIRLPIRFFPQKMLIRLYQLLRFI
jgi:glycosyltransferase involved in cell wall biosynthesis